MAPRILFLDDDPVIRVLRMVLSDAEHDPWIRDYFAPEKVDVSRLAGERFAALQNVVLTPHVAGGAKSGLLDEFEVVVRNCHAVLRGEPALHEVRVARPS